MRLAAASALAAALMFAAPLPVSAQGADNGGSDYAKKAGNFLKNCDARADENGKRPDPPNYLCLAFLAGLVEGYNYGAITNGNEKPYCLPRPVSLAELSDMIVTVIERGVKQDMATAAVFHFIMLETFECEKDATLLDEGENTIELAQADQLLSVTPPSEVGAREQKLPIVTPSNGSSEPLLPIVGPASTSRPTGTGSDTAAPSEAAGTPATPSGTTPATGTSPGSGTAAAQELPPLVYPSIASPTRPATPARPAGPQGPRRVGN